MAPGMPNAAIAIGDRIGHITNYGDGWYGGVYVGAMYSLAFTSTDIPSVVNQALARRLTRCMPSVISTPLRSLNETAASLSAIQ